MVKNLRLSIKGDIVGLDNKSPQKGFGKESIRREKGATGGVSRTQGVRHENLDHKPTRNKTHNLYLMVTAAGKRTKKKTGIQLKRIDDFNPQCKGNSWIRANVPEAKALNEQLRVMLMQANKTYRELASDGDVSSAKVRVQQAVELLKGMPPEQIMAVISAINK